MYCSSIGGIIAVGGYGVALRILSVLITPIFGIGVANITVVGMAYGEKNKANISKSFNYSTKMTLKIAIVTCSFILIFAPYLAELFAYGESSQNINAIEKIKCIFKNNGLNNLLLLIYLN